MKISSPIVYTTLVALASASVALAQPNDSKAPAERAAKHLERMKSSLELSEDQVSKIQTVMKEQAAAREALAKEALTAEARRAKGKALMDSTREKIDAILTTEQREKRDAMRGKKGGGPGPKGEKGGEGTKPKSDS